MRYWPASFVVTDRTFSISAGLDASTLTPGSTAPDVSRTTPVIDACAYKSEGMMRSPMEAQAGCSRCIRPPHVTWVYACADSNAPWDLDVGIWDLGVFSARSLPRAVRLVTRSRCTMLPRARRRHR